MKNKIADEINDIANQIASQEKEDISKTKKIIIYTNKYEDVTRANEFYKGPPQEIDERIHITALAILEHVHEYGEASLANKLCHSMLGIPRKNTLIHWFIKHGRMRLSKTKDKLLYNSGFATKYDEGAEKPFWKAVRDEWRNNFIKYAAVTYDEDDDEFIFNGINPIKAKAFPSRSDEYLKTESLRHKSTAEIYKRSGDLKNAKEHLKKADRYEEVLKLRAFLKKQ